MNAFLQDIEFILNWHSRHVRVGKKLPPDSLSRTASCLFGLEDVSGSNYDIKVTS